MTLVAAVGYVAYEISEGGFGAETAAVLSSFAIGLTGILIAFIIVVSCTGSNLKNDLRESNNHGLLLRSFFHKWRISWMWEF